MSRRSEYFVRIDDFPTGIRPKIANYRSAAYKIFKEFEIREIPYLLAVVPSQLEEEDREFLAGLTHATISLHGVTHSYAAPNGHVQNEFSNKSVSEDIELLKAGLEMLGDIPTASFVPPHNVYDANLLTAAKKTGIKICYGGFPKTWMKKASIPVFHSYPPMYGTALEVLGRFGEEKVSRSPKDRARTLKFRSGKLVWDRFRQAKGASPRIKSTTQIALHWTWENDAIGTERYRVAELAEYLTTQTAIDEATLLAD